MHEIDCVCWRPTGDLMENIYSFFLGGADRRPPIGCVRTPYSNYAPEACSTVSTQRAVRRDHAAMLFGCLRSGAPHLKQTDLVWNHEDRYRLRTQVRTTHTHTHTRMHARTHTRQATGTVHLRLHIVTKGFSKFGVA
jgi:hypothetical protein